jgi:hypothetical protein
VVAGLVTGESIINPDARLTDAEKIRAYLAKAEPRRLVFIGAGFISLELAALLSSLQTETRDMTVIELLPHPLPLLLDAEFGRTVQDYLVDQGLEMRTGAKVTRILGGDGTVTGVELSGGERLPADMVFLNVGGQSQRPSAGLGTWISRTQSSGTAKPPHRGRCRGFSRVWNTFRQAYGVGRTTSSRQASLAVNALQRPPAFVAGRRPEAGIRVGIDPRAGHHHSQAVRIGQ